MNKLYKETFSFLFVFILVLVGSFTTSVFKAQAVANITITSAKITAGNEVTVIFNTGGDNLDTAPITAYGIADNGVASLTLTSDGGHPRNLSGVVITPTTFTAVYTFTGTPATKYDTGSLAVHAPDAILDTNTTPDSLDHSIVSIPLTDGQRPTLAASNIYVRNDVQPNKVILTFSEPLEITAAQTVGNYIVTNGTIIYTIATAVLSPSNTVTLTLATVNPADNKTFITNDAWRITQIRVTPNAGITDTATPANPYAGGLVTADVNGTYDGTPATVTATLVRTNATTYKVTFSEKLDLTTAQTLNKYTLGGTCLASTGNPSAAVLQANGVDVVLTIPDTSGCAGGQTVIVTPLATITDVAGTGITSSAATKILATTAIITISSAKITGPNKITIGFNPGTGSMSAAPITAFGAGALALTAGGARSITSLDSLIGNTAVYTFNGAAAALNETAILTFTTPTDITDTGANTFDAVHDSPLTISDGQAPVVTSVVITAGAYKIGSVIPVTITADSAGYTAGAITINSHALGSFHNVGDGTYTGTYTVISGDINRASVGDFSISVVLTDADPNSNVPYTAAATSGGTVTIDANAPTAFTVGSVITTGAPIVVGKWNSTNTGVDVTVPVENDVSLTGGTIQVKANRGDGFINLGSAYTILVGDLGVTKTLYFSKVQFEALTNFAENDTWSFTAVITDLAGNSTTGTASVTSLEVDRVAPTAPTFIHIVSNDSPDNTLAMSGNIVIVTATVDSSTTVTGTIGGLATTSNVVIGTTATLARTLNGSETESAGLDFTLVSTDAAGNSAVAITKADIVDSSAVRTDFTPPTVSYIHRITASDTNATSVDFLVKFNESAMDVSTADFATTGTVSGSSVTTVTPNDDASTRTVSVNTGTGDGILGLNVLAGPGVEDFAGNVLTDASVSDSETYSIDKILPSNPTATPDAGIYTTTQSVTLTSGYDAVHYSTTGTADCSSTLASGVILVSVTTTISAITCDTAGNFSSAVPFTYTINTAATHSSGGGYITRNINLLALSGECKLGNLFNVITGKPCPNSSSTSSTTTTSTPILTSCSIYGSTQELVKEKTRGINAKGVQNAINQLLTSTTPLVIDGIIGSLSEAGIKNSQKILLVIPDGTWGPKTQQAYELFIKKQCPAV